MLAILAMDSYNRGYDQRIAGLKDIGSIGNVDIGNLSIFEPGSDGLRADFFAIEYEYDGETIIAYRGTDNLAKDAVNGYGVGAGFTGGIFAPQADLAIEFYKSITGLNVLETVTPANVTELR